MEYENESRTEGQTDYILKELGRLIQDSPEDGDFELDNHQEYIDAIRLMVDMIEGETDQTRKSLLAMVAKNAFRIIIPGKSRNEF